MNEVRKHYPVASDTGVYGIKQGNKLVYIGSTDKMPWRLYQHFECNQSFKDGKSKMERKMLYTWHVLWHGDSLDDARHQEKCLIQLHNPTYNVIQYKNYRR